MSVIADYIAAQAPERQETLAAIHSIITEGDMSVIAEVGDMMRNTMILYKERGYFKYGLASMKNYMSLHAMPIYMDTLLHAKYKQLLSAAEFQKGCMNFKTGADVPLPVIRQFLAECSKINIADMLEKRSKPKKS